MATIYGETYALRVIDHIEPMHPDQCMSTGWRWGPNWRSGDEGEWEGTWAVSRINITHGPVAIRLRFDADEELMTFGQFTARLDDLLSGCLDVDDHLRALNKPKSPRKPRRATVPKVMAVDLAALNELARREFGAE